MNASERPSRRLRWGALGIAVVLLALAGWSVGQCTPHAEERERESALEQASPAEGPDEPSERRAATEGDAPQPEEPPVAQAADEPEQEPPPPVVVRVFDHATGEPVGGARVSVSRRPDQLSPPGTPRKIVWTETDGQGVAVAPVPDGWRSARLMAFATADEGALASPSYVEAKAGADLEVWLEPAPRIEGTVRGLRDTDPSDVRVRVFNIRWPEAPGRRDIPVDDDGRFSVTGFQGLVTMYAIAPGRAASEYWSGSTKKGPEGSDRVLLTAGETTHVTLTLGPEATSRSVRFVLPDGTPLRPGTPVSAGSAGSMWTPHVIGEDGLVELGHLAPGRDVKFRVWPYRDPETGRWQNVRWDRKIPWREFTSLREIQVPAAQGRTVTVLDRNGHPVPDLPLIAYFHGDREAELDDRYLRSRTDASGKIPEFRESSLPRGRYTIHTLVHPDLESSDSRASELVLFEGDLDGTEDVRLVLPADRFTVLRVRLVDRNGRPVVSPFAHVGIVRRGRRPRPPVTSQPSRDDWQSFRRHSTATLLVREHSRGHVVVRVRTLLLPPRDFDVPADGELEVPLDGRTGRVRLQVADPTAKSVSFRFQWSGDERVGPYVSLRAHDPKPFIVEGVPPGLWNWKARIRSVDRAHTGRDVPVRPRTTTQIVVGE